MTEAPWCATTSWWPAAGARVRGVHRAARDFKPPEHNLLGSPIAETVFEPRVGGHIVDRGEDGSECRWARMLAFEPPDRRRLQLGHRPDLAARATPSTPARSRSGSSPDGPDRTRVELEHRHLDRHGPGWPALREGVAGDEGWPLYLVRYAALLESADLHP